MRFHETLQLQKQQAEQSERQQEAQNKLEVVARQINSQFDYWCQFRDPFAESYARIMRAKNLTGGTTDQLQGPGGRHSIPATAPLSSTSSSKDGSKSLASSTVSGGVSAAGTSQSGEPANTTTTSTDLNHIAFNLYRKLKFG